jgi:glycosyltransferase involved in cell wall biosynthesis
MYKGEKINVIMPVYNEEKTVGGIVDRVLKQDCVGRLIVIDDSKDRSMDILRKKKAKDRRITLLHNERPMGKGNALVRGIKSVKSGLILIQDADEEYFPEDYPKLLRALANGRAVYGTRMLGRNLGHQYRLARVGNELMSLSFSLFFHKKLTDINTCYKLFRREMLDPDKLKKRDFIIEEEMSIHFVRNGFDIVEVPIRYKGRTFEEGKKINAMHGFSGLFYIIKEGVKYAFAFEGAPGRR